MYEIMTSYQAQTKEIDKQQVNRARSLTTLDEAQAPSVCVLVRRQAD